MSDFSEELSEKLIRARITIIKLRIALEHITIPNVEERQWDHPPHPKVWVCNYCEEEAPESNLIIHAGSCPTAIAILALAEPDWS